MDLENFVGLLGFSSVAVLAPVLRVDPLPFAAAIRTHLLHLKSNMNVFIGLNVEKLS